MAGMTGLKKTRRIQIVVLAFAAMALSTALIGYAMKGGINFFRSPTQVTTEPPRPGEVFRIGGLVAVGSLVRGEGGSAAGIAQSSIGSATLRGMSGGRVLGHAKTGSGDGSWPISATSIFDRSAGVR